MTVPVPDHPKIFHIVHVDRLASIANDRALWCDREVALRQPPGTTIGMGDIKRRRLEELRLKSHPALHVGDCVPFYFCARSIMLYMIHMANHPQMVYRGGQEPIVHLQADLHAVVAWADGQGKRWAFTLQNAGTRYFDDHGDLSQLHRIDWAAVQSHQWRHCKEGKQAEFLLERSLPWHLVERVGVRSHAIHRAAVDALPPHGHRPAVEILPDWYY